MNQYQCGGERILSTSRISGDVEIVTIQRVEADIEAMTPHESVAEFERLHHFRPTHVDANEVFGCESCGSILLDGLDRIVTEPEEGDRYCLKCVEQFEEAAEQDAEHDVYLPGDEIDYH